MFTYATILTISPKLVILDLSVEDEPECSGGNTGEKVPCKKKQLVHKLVVLVVHM